MSATTATEARTTLTRRSSGRPTVFHHCRKDAITESIVTGIEIPTLCGARIRVGDANPGAHRGGSAVVCPKCSDIYDGLRPGGDR
jgi:hypothetical protein